MNARSPLLLAALLFSGCIQVPPAPSHDGVAIGALLPFTGDLSAAGANLERAILMAVGAINDGGGVAGQKLRLVSRDTHSDLDRGLAAGRELIEQENVFAIIGPEDAALAEAMVPLLRANKVLQISGGATSPVFSTEAADYWYRVVPSAVKIGGALADRMRADGVTRLSILYVNDPYGRAFSSVVRTGFEKAGVTEIGVMVPFEPGQIGYAHELQLLASSTPDAILLVAYPKSGAAIIQEGALLSGKRWYFAPSLRADDFVQNVPPGALEGMVGVSAALPADAEEFATAFASRWNDEQPLPNAYFYYDALAVAALSIAAASQEAGALAKREDVAKWVQPVSTPGGTLVTWSEMKLGLDELSVGDDINYRGASGSVDFNQQGDVAQGLVQFWEIRDGKLASLSQ